MYHAAGSAPVVAMVLVQSKNRPVTRPLHDLPQLVPGRQVETLCFPGIAAGDHEPDQDRCSDHGQESTPTGLCRASRCALKMNRTVTRFTSVGHAPATCGGGICTPSRQS